ncbi:MAG: endonuclease/exonuclease/phosphatase family protein [Planctomycetes bacterium]|nr:endonuclease/exonuclease/phosphatase family protein [Planctomycetota bacterium]
MHGSNWAVATGNRGAISIAVSAGWGGINDRAFGDKALACWRNLFALQKIQPQLAFFQEATLEEEAEFQAEGYVKNYVGDFLLLMKPEVEVVVEPHFPEWTDTPSAVMTIRFEDPYVHIYSLHPRSPMSVRRLRHRNQFFEQLQSKINASNHACIVIGDLNTTPTDDAFKTLLANSNLRNSMIGFGWQTSWPYDHAVLSALRIPIQSQTVVCARAIDYAGLRKPYFRPPNANLRNMPNKTTAIKKRWPVFQFTKV